jgi:hypothetical protein
MRISAFIGRACQVWRVIGTKRALEVPVEPLSASAVVYTDSAFATSCNASTQACDWGEGMATGVATTVDMMRMNSEVVLESNILVKGCERGLVF